MKIEVWSDTVCPWCYIGLKRLQKALDLRPETTAEVRWLPFELNPDLPEAGTDRKTYLQQKFGDPDRFQGMQWTMRRIAAVGQHEYAAHRMQINGVPTFVFDRNAGFSGAQEVEVFLQEMDRVAADAGR